jgi:ATP diphosphatase
VVADDADTVISNWEEIKSEEKRRDSIMDDIPSAMPALVRADKVQRRARSVGFDWADSAPVFAKIREELEELAAEMHDPVRATEEFGDLLFAAVNLSRHLGVDPELALAGANDRFAARIRHMEAAATAGGRSLADYSLDELDRMWNRAKQSLQG